jgi:hypothetical protein
MSIVTNSVIFVHNQTNGYVYAPQYASTVWPAGPLGGRSGLIQLTNDYIIALTVQSGGTNYSAGSVPYYVGNPWYRGWLVPQGTQCVSNGNVYTATTSGTAGSTAPNWTSGSGSDGGVTWSYAGTAATITFNPTAGSITQTGSVIATGGSGYLTTPTINFGYPWVASLPVTLNEVLVYSGNYYTVTTAGTLGTAGPTFTSGSAANGTATLTYGGTVAIVTATLNGFPQGGLVPGAAYLDTYTVVGQSTGQLFCSNVNDPTTWNALATVTSYAEPNSLVGISKHLQYVVAFSQWSTNFFYDAGTAPPLSPLTPASTYGFEIGCANGSSIAQVDQSVLWVGQSKTTGPAVYMLEGLGPAKVSTAYIEKILEESNLTEMTAYTFKYDGHTFYVLTLGDLNVTIVYDIGEKMWANWTYYTLGDASSGVPGIYAEQYFRPSYYAGSYGQAGAGSIGTNYYFLDDDNGTLYTLDDSNYNDAGAPIYFRVITPIIDSGTTKRKFHRSMEIVGDKIPATLKLRYTDNDYQTWSPYRSVNLNQERPIVQQLGQARRRAYEFFCTDNQPLRFEAAELNFDVGEMEGQGGQ